jgi:hypothetical protein
MTLALAIAVAGVGSAQVVERRIEKYEDSKVIKTFTQREGEQVLLKEIVLPKRINKHDIRVGVGSLGLWSWLLLDDSYYHKDKIIPGFGGQLSEADTYRTPRWFVGNYTLSYLYHDRRWLQYGGMVTFGASTCRTRHVVTGEKLDNNNMYLLGVMPTVRFVWYWREKVQLYSSVSLGVMTDMYEILPWGDVTLVGCMFGRKLFGFAEIGGGMSGVFRIGMGYRFDAAKKNKK